MTLTIDYQTEELGNDERFPSEKRLQRWLDTAYEALALSEALELTVRLVDNDEMRNSTANTGAKTRRPTSSPSPATGIYRKNRASSATS